MVKIKKIWQRLFLVLNLKICDQHAFAQHIRFIIEYILWTCVSIYIWKKSYTEILALYPDWDDETAKYLGKLTHAILVLSWLLLIISMSAKSLKRLRLWFKIGICFSFFLIIVRFSFYREMNEFFDYLIKHGFYVK